VTANERNALVTVAPDGTVQEVTKNGSTGPLEFPSAIVFVGNTAYISNFDQPRRDNMDANGETAMASAPPSPRLIHSRLLKRLGMLRDPQHERKNINDINTLPFVLSLVEGLRKSFSATSLS
jgi:hypothetical protein